MTMTERPHSADVEHDTPPGVQPDKPSAKVAERRVKRFSIAGLAKRLWMVLLIAAVVAVGGFCVHRLHGVFGVHGNTFGTGAVSNDIVPFNPKVVILEVFGAPGNVATINYLDVNAKPQQVLDTTLPWSLTITTTLPAVAANLVAQGNGDSIGCRITVDGVVKNERFVNEVHAYTFCLDKSA